MWYLILASVGGQIAYSLIFGPRFWFLDGAVDHARKISWICTTVASASAVLSLGVFQDAIPPQIAKPRIRLCGWAFLFVYKSEDLNLHSQLNLEISK